MCQKTSADPTGSGNRIYVDQLVSLRCSRALCPPTDSIMRLMPVWRKTGKIIRTGITIKYAQL